MARTGASYKQTIDSFKVETNSKYLKSGSTMYCNVFAQDVMKELSASLPTGNCNSILTSLTSGFSKWTNTTSYATAQSKANSGKPTVAITHDHIAVVRPHDTAPTAIGQVRITQAGGTNYNNTTLSWGWASNRHSEVKFYYYND